MMEHQRKNASYDLAITSMADIAEAVARAEKQAILAAEVAAIEASNAAAAAEAEAEAVKLKGKNKNLPAAVANITITANVEESSAANAVSENLSAIAAEDMKDSCISPPFAKLIVILLPDYIETELVPEYTNTFVKHLSAYKLAFKNCKFMKNAWVERTW